MSQKENFIRSLVELWQCVTSNKTLNMMIPQGTSSHFFLSFKDETIKDAKESTGATVEKNPAMSFTIDLDDRPKKVNVGVSLSNFVPSKMRKSIQERKEKAYARRGSKESTPTKTSVSKSDNGLLTRLSNCRPISPSNSE